MNREFIDSVKYLVLTKLLGETEGITVNDQPVIKNNSVRLTGLIIKSPGVNIAPTIYLDGYYKDYENGEKSVEEIAEAIISCYKQNALSRDFDISPIHDVEKVKAMVYPCVINTDANSEWLKSHPHKNLLDLSICYRLDVDLTPHQSIEGNGSIAVTDALLNMWNLTLDELDEAAWKNNKVLFEPAFQNMIDVMAELVDFPDDSMMDSYDASPMYVLSNTTRLNGSNYIADNDILHDIASELGSDEIYIIPSSRHELIILPATISYDRASLKDMIREVNETQVSAEDRLSDNLYLFSTATNQLEICA